MPRLSASAFASSREPAELNRDGIETPRTFSGPSASAAITAVSAESIPPLSPSTADWNPHL